MNTLLKSALILSAFYLTSVLAAKFRIRFPDGTVIYDNLENLDEVIKHDDRLKSIILTQSVQHKLSERYRKVDQEMPRFHQLTNMTSRNPQQETELHKLAETVFDKYYKPLFVVSLGLEGIFFTVEK